MRHLPIRTEAFRTYQQEFSAWLATVGYSSSTTRSVPGMLQEFLHWLEGRGVADIQDITAAGQRDYIHYITHRRNNRREGALSAIHINSHIRMLDRFREYMGAVHHLHLPAGAERLAEEDKTDWVVLDTKEIRRLYESTEDHVYGIRDKAMLAVYYGCGCRKSEGAALDTSDVLFERKLLYIRKSKNGHERYVPMTAAVQRYLRQYLDEARPLLVKEERDPAAFFISQRSGRLSAEMLYLRIKALQHKAGLNKEIGLHTLRHSIATHLLQKGMSLENIALFLGHRSLDSTQIYTHIKPIL